jgi:hypothetical protein
VRLRDDPVARRARRAGRDQRFEQRRARPRASPSSSQLRQARDSRLVARLADGEDDRDRLGEQPARHEPSTCRWRRRATGDRPRGTAAAAPRHLRQEGERGQAHEEAVGGAAGAEAERDAQRGLLRRRQRVEPVEERRAQLVQPANGSSRSDSTPETCASPEAGRLLGGVAHERRLAHAGLAADDEHGAARAARVGEQPVQRLTFAGSAAERRRCLRGHGAHTVPVTDPGVPRARRRPTSRS